MKGKKPKRSLLQWISERIDAKRPPLIPPPRKSWVEWGALKTAELSVRGTAKTAKAVYYGLTPEQMPDARYESSLALHQQMEEVGLIDIDDAVERIYEQIPKPLTIYRDIIRQLITPELTPPAPPHDEPIAHAKWRDQARRYIDLRQSGRKRLAEPILAMINEISRALPPPSNSKLRLPITELLPNVPATIERVVDAFHENYPSLRERLQANLLDERDQPVLPTKSKLQPQEIPEAYLKNTPLLTLFKARVPLEIPDRIRFAHTWMIAGSGHGKTTFLAGLLKQDIEAIKRGQRSAIVMDSQYTIIRDLMRLDVPKIIIDPTDVRHPIALNIFDAGLDKVTDVDEREGLVINAIENFSFVFSALLDQPMTPRQNTLFTLVSKLLITQVKGATIHDFRNLLDLQRAKKGYEEAWLRMDPDDRDYFETDFSFNSEVKATREQVLSRLRTLLSNGLFTRMFAAPKSKINLFEETNKGKLIIINTDKHRIGKIGAKVFGRFWISQILFAAQRRAHAKQKLPTFVYIDEAQDYLAGGDPNITDILEQARKQNFGLMVIHHYTDQFQGNPRLLSSLSANTAIKLCGSPEYGDETSFAAMLRTSKEFILAQQPAEAFACFVRDKEFPPTAFSLKFPNVKLEPELNDEQFSVMLAANRAAYCYQPESTAEHSDTGTKPSSDGKANSGLSEDY